MREPEEAWAEFLQEYSTLIFSIAQHLERDIDRASDCFQFVCERLSADGFRRLRRFKPQGPASFPTWLRAVVRNLCLDWRRKEFGRRRVFRSIARLSSFDQEVFRYVYERGDSIDDTFVLLQSRFSDVTPERLAESLLGDGAKHFASDSSVAVEWRSAVLEDAGNSNRDFDFRYDQTLGGAPLTCC